jgi:excisionase family DNA binding protein
MTAQTLSPTEAGRMLGIGRNLTFRLIHEGTIPALRLGKKLRVPVAALEDLLRHPPCDMKSNE